MATIQVILNGMPGGTMHDTEQYPVVLRFEDDKDIQNAVWIIPSFPGHIPATMLSEIRVQAGPLQAVVEGPEGFQSGPHETNWVRCDYPRGKIVSFLKPSEDPRKLAGVSVSIVEDSLVVDEIAPVGGSSSSTTSGGANPSA